DGRWQMNPVTKSLRVKFGMKEVEKLTKLKEQLINSLPPELVPKWLADLAPDTVTRYMKADFNELPDDLVAKIMKEYKYGLHCRLAIHMLKPVMRQLEEYVNIWNKNEENAEDDYWSECCGPYDYTSDWAEKKPDFEEFKFMPSSITLIDEDDLPVFDGQDYLREDPKLNYQLNYA
ncbi:hypothetical protein OAO87_02995, partial [bacterium]|nr:hypothetical protein [bacterium]